MSIRSIPGRQKPYCCYCRRELSPSQPERSTSATRDHVKCVKDGGMRWVPCCRKCNLLKGDLPIDDWRWFTSTHPRWWKLYDTTEQVEAVVRAFRFEQAMARKRDALRYGT